MPAAISRQSYTDCYDLLDQAIQDSKGIRIRCANYGDAKQLQMRIHAAKNIDRKANMETYPNDHPLYQSSVYNGLRTEIRPEEGIWWLTIKHISAGDYVVESLSVGE